jgi:anti-sigma regulatory factor (Ser/Thr protein kinase)
MSADEISLTLPADDAFHRVAHLVLGGFALRQDLTYENLEDLELALDALLERTQGEEPVNVRVRIVDGELRTTVGPFVALRAELDRGGTDILNLSRILAAVCDRVEIDDRDGSEWVQLTKRVHTLKGGAA